MLDDQEMVNCQLCTPHQKTSRKESTRFSRLPRVLCIQLKRYEHVNNVSQKVDTAVVYPETLHVTEESTPGVTSNRTYDLVAVIHHGSGNNDLHHGGSGHYTATCRIFTSNDMTVQNEKKEHVIFYPRF